MTLSIGFGIGLVVAFTVVACCFFVTRMIRDIKTDTVRQVRDKTASTAKFTNCKFEEKSETEKQILSMLLETFKDGIEEARKDSNDKSCDCAENTCEPTERAE